MLFAITLTWPKTVFTKKTLIFSKTVENSHKNALNQCFAMKPSNFSNELLLVFQKKHVICNHTNLA